MLIAAILGPHVLAFQHRRHFLLTVGTCLGPMPSTRLFTTFFASKHFFMIVYVGMFAFDMWAGRVIIYKAARGIFSNDLQSDCFFILNDLLVIVSGSSCSVLEKKNGFSWIQQNVFCCQKKCFAGSKPAIRSNCKDENQNILS